MNSDFAETQTQFWNVSLSCAMCGRAYRYYIRCKLVRIPAGLLLLVVIPIEAIPGTRYSNTPRIIRLSIRTFCMRGAPLGTQCTACTINGGICPRRAAAEAILSRNSSTRAFTQLLVKCTYGQIIVKRSNDQFVFIPALPPVPAAISPLIWRARARAETKQSCPTKLPGTKRSFAR